MLNKALAWAMIWIAFWLTAMILPSVIQWHQSHWNEVYDPTPGNLLIGITGALLFVFMCIDVLKSRTVPKK